MTVHKKIDEDFEMEASENLRVVQFCYDNTYMIVKTFFITRLKFLLREQSKLLFHIRKSLNPESLEDLEKSKNWMKFRKRRLSYQI